MKTKFTEKVRKAMEKAGFKNEWEFLTGIPKEIKDALIIYGANVKLQRMHAGKAKEKSETEIIKDYCKLIDNWKKGLFNLTAEPVDKEAIKRQAIQELLASLPPDLQKIIKEKAGI